MGPKGRQYLFQQRGRGAISKPRRFTWNLHPVPRNLYRWISLVNSFPAIYIYASFGGELRALGHYQVIAILSDQILALLLNCP